MVLFLVLARKKSKHAEVRSRGGIHETRECRDGCTCTIASERAHVIPKAAAVDRTAPSSEEQEDSIGRGPVGVGVGGGGAGVG